MPKIDRKREQGIALLISMMVLISLSLLVMGSLESVMRDQQIAGFQNRKRVALHAADAGSSAARAAVFGAVTPTLAATDLGDAALYPNGMPSFRLDPAATDPIFYMGYTPWAAGSLNISNGSPKFEVRFWRFQIEGVEPTGSTARVEFATGVFTGN